MLQGRIPVAYIASRVNRSHIPLLLAKARREHMVSWRVRSACGFSQWENPTTRSSCCSPTEAALVAGGLHVGLDLGRLQLEGFSMLQKRLSITQKGHARSYRSKTSGHFPLLLRH